MYKSDKDSRKSGTRWSRHDFRYSKFHDPHISSSVASTLVDPLDITTGYITVDWTKELDLSSLCINSTFHEDLKLVEYSITSTPRTSPRVAPFSVFSTRQKWVITLVAGLAGLFSPFTANIYFPAIQKLADAFKTSVELINVTVTVYMIFQGISPMIWGTLSDRIGRRPLFLVCLAILCISCVGLALVPTDAYWLLLVLRCFQAAGSASTVSLGSGTISDITEPYERGGYLGVFGLGPLVGLCLGPIVGGAFAGTIGWRPIFWFLTISSGTYFLFILSFFPETLRVVVGNGSVKPPRWNREIFPVLNKSTSFDTDTLAPAPSEFLNPLRQFTHPSVVLILILHGTIYSIFYSITATMSDIYAAAYPFLTEGEIGLCYLAAGVGCIVGSILNGKFLDEDFRRVEKKILARESSGGGFKVKLRSPMGRFDPKFPIEYARLRGMPVYVGVYALCISAYGWAVQKRAPIGWTLVFQFIAGFMLTCVTNTSQTILMDLFPTQCSSISGANNLVKCTMGAILTSCIAFIVKALQPGWTYTLLGAICLAVLPMSFAVVRYGPKWREKWGNKNKYVDSHFGEKQSRL